MIRAIVVGVAAFTIGAVVLVGLQVGSSIDDHVGVRKVAVTTSTSWVETQPSLPAGFDPAKLRPKHSRRAPTARRWTWDDMAACESGGRWDDTRGGYEGGLHFLHETWVLAGGRRYAEHAYQATRAEQIEIAADWLARTSLAQWPSCSYTIGAR